MHEPDRGDSLTIRVVAYELRDHRLTPQPVRGPEDQHVEQDSDGMENIGGDAQRVPCPLGIEVVRCRRSGPEEERHHQRQCR